ncbi:Protein CBG19305 [Caenorhabditis briggsae]|uniref:Uncharacterized protein n=2 Tax=Caenorhabditis briggsae TaxID=6238 RepID=A0AAE9F6X3_CAEBR|nr:Protein CBG19305 [Caenorhabditis briggsae]ULT90843.1 hypothetical protein L3Y34_008863 [Caenorhabditis briggsae]UMM36619.1 hypothetical protein L5515_008701 [Caenorhabditis briggsae]CAP36580.1 Protein CBG19305 [Caenorhabditis briggsae]
MPKNTKKSQGNKKLQLSDKQFADLLKEIGGGLPEGLALDPALLGALRQATNDQFNKVATEKYGEIPSDEEEEEMESEQQQQSTSGQKNDQQGSSNNA